MLKDKGGKGGGVFWGEGVLKKGGDTSLVAQWTKNLPANAGDTGSIPGQEDSTMTEPVL